MAKETYPRLLIDRSNAAVYYNALADELEELSNFAHAHLPQDDGTAKRLKAFADEIRVEINQQWHQEPLGSRADGHFLAFSDSSDPQLFRA